MDLESQERVAAIVLNWNQAALTLECLACLAKQTHRHHIIVVDNGSRPEEVQVLTAGLPSNVTYISLRTNHGFAGGMNAGIQVAGKMNIEFSWLLNNDAFPKPKCLAQLVAAMQADRTLAGVTPHLVGTDGIEQAAGGCYRSDIGTNQLLSTKQMAQPRGQGYWIVGAAPLCRTNALLHAGGFDERYFAYMEETDLFLRLSYRGHCFRSVPEAYVLHLGQVSSGGYGNAVSYYLCTRNRYRLWLRHRKRSSSYRFRLHFIVSCLDHAGCYAIRGQQDKANTMVAVIFAVLLQEQGKPKLLGRYPTIYGRIARSPWRIIRFIKMVQSVMNWLQPSPNVSHQQQIEAS